MPAFINTLRFSLQLLCCEAFFFSAMPLRQGKRWRIPLAVFGYILLGYGAQGLLDRLPMPESATLIGLVWSVYFFLLFLLSLGVGALVCSSENCWEYVSAGVGGYAAQHITFCLVRIVRHFLPQDLVRGTVASYLCFHTIPYLLIGLLFYLWLIRPSVRNGKKATVSWQRIVLATVILVSCLVLSSFGSNLISADGLVVCRLYAIISCTLAIYIQYLYSDQERLEWEKDEMERLLHVSQQQSKMSAEAVEVINLKYHDLKHLLSQLQNRISRSDVEGLTQEIAEAIDVYDSLNKTGSDALDVVLMQKALLCEGYHIAFDYLGSGENLSFMSAPDIASLFSNALDNAIESQLREEEGKRFINMQIKTMGNILLIHVDNYCTHPPVFNNGMPETHKEDKKYNGFGVKSIQYIANKYHGQMRVSMENDTFQLDVMLPMNAQEE